MPFSLFSPAILAEPCRIQLFACIWKWIHLTCTKKGTFHRRQREVHLAMGSPMNCRTCTHFVAKYLYLPTRQVSMQLISGDFTMNCTNKHQTPAGAIDGVVWCSLARFHEQTTGHWIWSYTWSSIHNNPRLNTQCLEHIEEKINHRNALNCSSLFRTKYTQYGRIALKVTIKSFHQICHIVDCGTEQAGKARQSICFYLQPIDMLSTIATLNNRLRFFSWKLGQNACVYRHTYECLVVYSSVYWAKKLTGQAEDFSHKRIRQQKLSSHFEKRAQKVENEEKNSPSRWIWCHVQIDGFVCSNSVTLAVLNFKRVLWNRSDILAKYQMFE